MANTLKVVGSNLTTGLGMTSVYSAPALTSVTVLSLTLCNIHSAGIQVWVYLYKAGSTPFCIASGVAIPVGSTFVAIGEGQKLVMQAGDVLKVQTFTGPCDAVLSLIEVV